jgi:predicted dehydrogenase
MVGHLLLYQPAIAWIRSQIRAGALGDIWHIETRRLNLGKVRQVENVFWSFAPHDLAVIHSLLGEPALVAASARGQCNIQANASRRAGAANIDDQVHADYTFAGGATGHVHTAWFWPTKLRVTTVIGSKSMIVYDEVAQTVTHYDSTIDPQTLQTKGGKGEVVPVAEGEPLRRECQHFLNCIATRRQALSHGRHGVEVVRMLAAADKELQA